MYFRILGPVDIRDGHRSHPIPQGTLQLLLAALLVDAGRLVPRESLIQRIWHDKAPAKPHEALHLYIHRIRCIIRDAGGHDGVISSGPDGAYRADIEPAQTDVYEFEELIGAARITEEPDVARKMLANAEALWRGPALQGLAGPWAETVRRSLHHRRREALHAHIGLAIEAGEGEHAIKELIASACNSADPDTVHVALRILAEAERGPEAGRLYKAVRPRLPFRAATELAGLRQQAGTGSPTIAPPPRVHRHATVPGPYTLGHQRKVLIGREKETAAVLAAIAAADSAGPAVCVLEAPPGVGVNVLALHAAQLLADQCDGAVRLDFRRFGLEDPTVDQCAALTSLINSISPCVSDIDPDAPLADLVKRWQEAVRGKRLLVLAENATDAEQITPLIPETPGSIVIAATANRLDVPAAKTITVGPLGAIASIRLFQFAAQRTFPNERRTFRTVAGLAGGLPRALVILGTHLRANPDVSLAKATRALARARGELHDEPTAPLLAVFDLAYTRLPEKHRRMLAHLAGLPDGACSAEDPSPPAMAQAETGHVLDSLALRGIVDEIGPRRYRLPYALHTAVSLLGTQAR